MPRNVQRHDTMETGTGLMDMQGNSLFQNSNFLKFMITQFSIFCSLISSKIKWQEASEIVWLSIAREARCRSTLGKVKIKGEGQMVVVRDKNHIKLVYKPSHQWLREICTYIRAKSKTYQTKYMYLMDGCYM